MNTCYVFFKQQNTGWLLVRYTELHQQDAASMSGIKANSEDNLCCAASVTITRRARLDELMCENKLLRWSRDVGKFIIMDVNRRRGGGALLIAQIIQQIVDFVSSFIFIYYNITLYAPTYCGWKYVSALLVLITSGVLLLLLFGTNARCWIEGKKKTMICWSKVTFLTNVR